MTPEALMRRVATAFEKGDLEPLFEAIDDHTVWKTASALSDMFRFGGEYKKRIGITEVLSRIATAYVFRRFEPMEIVASGEIVWGLFQVEADYRPTGKKLKVEMAVRWRVRNGKIAEHQGFLDTASLLRQQGELPHPSP